MSDQLGLSLYCQSLYLVFAAFAVAFLIGHTVYVMVVLRPEQLTRTIIKDPRDNYLTAERLLPGVLIIVLLSPFTSAYTTFKVMIPLIQPYVWDPALAAFDRILHGDVEPWLLLQPLFAYLYEASQSMPVWALDVQSNLWNAYDSGRAGIGSGISAMPSMHVSMAFLLALFGWRKGPLLGVAFSLFAGAILLGSVHLGWHYAIDGYLAIFLTWGIWWVAGKYLRSEGVALVGSKCLKGHSAS